LFLLLLIKKKLFLDSPVVIIQKVTGYCPKA